MDFVSDHVLRTLWYVDLLAAQGQRLSPTGVDDFAQALPPRDVRRTSVMDGLHLQSSVLFDEVAVKRMPEPVADYLLSVRWITLVDGGVRLTDLGRAVLAGHGKKILQINASDPEVADVVLEPTDPIVYVQLTRRLAKAGAGLLVDAYFKAESLPWLIEATSLRRILVSSRHPKAARDLQTMAVALATVPDGSDVEVRHTSDPALHDRCVVSEQGGVQLLGSSVTGVGKHLTAVITPHDGIAKAYRKQYEELWRAAQVVAPQSIGP